MWFNIFSRVIRINSPPASTCKILKKQCVCAFWPGNFWLILFGWLIAAIADSAIFQFCFGRRENDQTNYVFVGVARVFYLPCEPVYKQGGFALTRYCYVQIFMVHLILLFGSESMESYRCNLTHRFYSHKIWKKQES